MEWDGMGWEGRDEVERMGWDEVEGMVRNEMEWGGMGWE